MTDSPRLHPNQKPLALLKKFLEVSSNPGDMVLDNFCGSGTTGVAAWQTGRRSLLIEANAEYAAAAQARLELTCRQPLLGL